MSEAEFAALLTRVDYLEKERVARLESIVAAKADVELERAARMSADLRLEDLITGMRGDVLAIRTSLTWAFRTIVTAVLGSTLGYLVYLATHHG